MRFTRRMYLSEGMEKKKDKVIRRLRMRNLARPVYLLALCDYGTERLEILSSAELLQRSYPSEGLLIAGLAGDYEDALDLVRQIAQETLDAGLETDVCSYIRGRERDR